MQNRYVGDIGDFGKFQLFRFLFTNDKRSLAQIWFLHHSEEENGDGSYTHYFERIKGSDPLLETIMIEILKTQKRDVHALETLEVLPSAHFYYPIIPTNYPKREVWFKEAISFSSPHPIVAVAPDNGMLLKCHKEEQRFSFLSYHDRKSKAHKYILEEEIAALFHTPHREITILYQHLGRCFSHDAQISALFKLLSEKYPHIVAIKHKPYSPRVFFFLCHDKKIVQNLTIKLKDFEKQHGEFWKLYL